MAKVIGGPIDPNVAEQIATRGDILSRKSRSIGDIQAYNARTGWARLSSSVNIDSSDSKAKSNVLSGPTLVDGRTQRAGVDLNGNTSSAAYKKGPLGFRPAPGITGVNISAINRFGTLRTAKVNFTCWDVDQLTDLEKLYMRPGFSVLLEWGHSLFLNNSGELQKTVTYIDEFFHIKGTGSKDTLQEYIKLVKITTNHNYDAIYGYVKNFQWSFRTDGGYDCSVEVISIGEVIESIRTTFSPGNSDDLTELEEDSKAKQEARKISPLHDFLGALTEVLPLYYDGFLGLGVNEIHIKKATDILSSASKTDFYYQTLRFFLINLRTEEGWTDKYDKFHYITLGTLLNAINNVFMISEGRSHYTSYFTGNSKNPEDTKPGSGLLYEIPEFNTFEGHFSLDPKICLIQSIPFNSDLSSAQGMGNLQRMGGYGTFIGSIPSTGASVRNPKITEIWVGVENLFEQLKQVSQNSNEEERTVENFLRKILSQMEDNLGGVNEFDVTFDEEHSKYIVVDRKKSVERSTLTTIDLTGLRTTLTELSFTSKLSPKLGTIIAISAQAKSGDAGIDAENMFKWNEGLQDRISPTKTLTPSAKTKTGEDPYSKARDSILNTYARATAEPGIFDYRSSEFDSLISAHKLVSRTLQAKPAAVKSTETKPGIIPFELSLTMDGIGGFKIGEAFKIAPGVLPANYQDRIAFVVTGVDHTISGNKWKTTIKAQTIVHNTSIE